MFKFWKKPSSASLVADIKNGGRKEDEAIAYMIEHNYDKIKYFIINKSGSEADAEDIFQEGLAAMILNVRKGSFKGDSSIHTYLYAICKGMWFKRFKKYVRDKDYKKSLDEPTTDFDTPFVKVIGEEQKQLLGKLFDKLRAKCKEVLFLWGQSYSMTEISQQLEFANAQVAMNKKNKCLKELRRLMTEDDSVKALLVDLKN